MRNLAPLFLPLPLVLVACGGPAAPSEWVGEEVHVQLRRDALGAAATVPIPANSLIHNGARVALTGSLEATTADGVIVDVDGLRHWVPRETILLLQRAAED